MLEFSKRFDHLLHLRLQELVLLLQLLDHFIMAQVLGVHQRVLVGVVVGLPSSSQDLALPAKNSVFSVLRVVRQDSFFLVIFFYKFFGRVFFERVLTIELLVNHKCLRLVGVLFG